MNLPKKSLGQHWLNDKSSLIAMCNAGMLKVNDVVLEIGPGPGALTKLLVERAKQVYAVEFDRVLAESLPSKVDANNLVVINQDFLKFDLNTLPSIYKVVANIPYYLSGEIVRVLCESANPPKLAALLVQKEVAQRMSALPGDLSILGVTTQMYYQVDALEIVKKELFWPIPKVDSQIIRLTKRPYPLFEGIDKQSLFRVVKAGFSNKRKTNT